jgi:hypothetical protein
MAVTTLLVTVQGQQVVAEGQRRVVDAHWQRGNSYFRMVGIGSRVLCIKVGIGAVRFRYLEALILILRLLLENKRENSRNVSLRFSPTAIPLEFCQSASY